jgi:putative hemolysin
MPQRRHIVRDITYAHSASTRGGQAMIRLLENSTGRRRLIKRAQGYETDLAQGLDFWSVMIKRYGLSLDIFSGALDNIPETGPLILTANHPYGILDGLVMGHILSRTRGDFRILANSVFSRSGEISRILLPISFDTTRAAMLQNMATRREALKYLRAGGAIGVFPGGTVSTGARMFSRPMDPGWRKFTARMAAKSGATVVPLYFDGHNSRLFQIASHLHVTLRLGLLIREFHDRLDAPVQIAIGQPIGRDILDPMAGDSNAMMDFLRKATYELSPTPLKSYEYGYDFEMRQNA